MTDIINSIANEKTEDWISIDITTYVDGERKNHHLSCDLITLKGLLDMDYFGTFGYTLGKMVKRDERTNKL